MKKRIAKYISIIGHPFLTFSIFILVVMFTFEEFHKALFISILIIGCIIIPNVIRNYIKTKRAEYTNFDVSVRTHRNSMYLFSIILSLIITIVMFISNQSKDLYLGVLFATILIIISYIVNFSIKCSAHVSLTIYLSFIIISMNLIIGITGLVFACLIGWSRLELGRHTIKEVITGAIIGMITGVAMLITQVF